MMALRGLFLLLGWLMACTGGADDDGPTGPGTGAADASAGGSSGTGGQAADAGGGGQAAPDAGPDAGWTGGDAAVDGTTLPRSSARIAGRVMGVTGTDLSHATVRAGGVPVLTDAFGGFVLDEVYGAATARVGISTPNFAPTEFDVPILAGQFTSALAYLQPLDATAQADADATAPVPLGTQAVLQPTPGALRQPWDAMATGTVTYEFAGFSSEGAGWAALPGDGTLANGERLEFTAAFYLNARQGGTALELGRAIELRYRFAGGPLSPETHDAGVPAYTLMLYRYEGVSGHFEPVMEVDVADHTVQLDVMAFGTYALGASFPPDRCAGVRVEDEDGAPAVRAAIRQYDYAHAGLAFTGTDGTACLDGSGRARGVNVDVSLRDGMRRQTASTSFVELVDVGVPACSEACATETTLTLVERSIGCVSGTLSSAGDAEGTVSIYGQSNADTVSFDVAAGEPFCQAVPAGEVTVSVRVGYPCESHTSETVNVGSCGAGDCVALGTVRCCGDHEDCDTAGWDDDCDGRVDEGCHCGERDCTTQVAHRGCCTADDLCGIEGVAVDSCFEYGAPSDPFDATCATETVAFEDDSQTFSGCCRPDGRCGLETVFYYGCVAREEFHEALPAIVTLPAASCSP